MHRPCVAMISSSFATIIGKRYGTRERSFKAKRARKEDETLRDSDSASEHQADLDRDAERVEADKAKLQSRSDSDASRDLGRADTEEAAQNARLKKMKGCEWKDKLRTKQSKANDSELMLLQKRDGAIISHPPSLPPNYYPRNNRATKKPRRLLLPGKNSPLL